MYRHFSGAGHLKKIHIFDAIEVIAPEAFLDCSNLSLPSSYLLQFFLSSSSSLDKYDNNVGNDNDITKKYENKDANVMLHFICDLNRCGRKYLRRRIDDGCDDYNEEDNTDDEKEAGRTKNDEKRNDGRGEMTTQGETQTTTTTKKKKKDTTEKRRQIIQYPSSLWPIILHRIYRKEKRIRFAKNKIILHDGTCPGYSRKSGYDPYIDNISVRRASAVYYLLVNGVAMECV